MKIPELSTPILGYYTVILGDNVLSEFEKFDAKDFSSHQDEIMKLYAVIKEMGLSGAKPYYFHPEGGFHYLPNLTAKEIAEANRPDYGIRLYSLYISPQIILLFNGGIKTNLKPENCNSVQLHFLQSKAISRKVIQALKDEYISQDRTNLIFDEGFEIDI